MYRVIGNILRTQTNKKKYVYLVGQNASRTIRWKTTFCIKNPLLEQKSFQQVHKKFKHSKKKQRNEEAYSSDDDEDSDDDTDLPHNSQKSKILEKKVGSLRLDVILKTGLGLGRNKINEAFYNSNIRLNERKVLKKSATVLIGDKIDLIRCRDANNPKLLNVSRVEVLKAKPQEDCISITLYRDKLLIIEDYKDPWKSSTS